MKFKVAIDIMPLKELLDPQGKAVGQTLTSIGFSAFENVRIGKHIELIVDAISADAASEIANDACEKLLCNKVMESYQVSISSL
jgi:phosphoribosylformylglycinamidine synthase